VVTFLFLVQALLAWRLSDASPRVVREESRWIVSRLVPPVVSPDLAALLQLNNPTLFVLPSRDGFSGRVWLEVRPLQHRSPGWSNPPQWLALKPEELLADFARFGGTNQPERTSVSDRLSRPQPTRVALSDAFRLVPETRVTLSGEVTLQDMVAPLDLPVVEHGGLLAPTVVSILVDQRGRVFQASLASGGSSGSPVADQLALESIRRLQFVVDPRISPSQDDRDFEQLRRAQFTVRWWTQLPAPATNTPTAQPVPLQ
jgi:hypothetical protein